MITNHTASDLVIRPPGMLATGRPVDEPALSDLGAKMVSHNGYANIRAYKCAYEFVPGELRLTSVRCSKEGRGAEGRDLQRFSISRSSFQLIEPDNF